ncbi:hypothetical protein [Kribbella sindirgiensis]|uniref:Uncharacterized protein n=1 Tax=Kribbella sindirgiensis TaxID=1124744 RepID=A0A4R0HUY5_9ACTN|nr:hypothetical protein [Kribbella sindirgiensis]TCC15661.1 hypothetical protein E0H50_41625 [Kribbella sindirgiensis]
MDFEEVFADVARVIEGAGVVIMAIGLAVVLVRYCVDVRTVLSFALEVEISGSWPWQTRRADAA